MFVCIVWVAVYATHKQLRVNSFGKENRVKKRMLKNIEWGILICSIALLVIGCISLYSATRGKQL